VLEIKAAAGSTVLEGADLLIIG